MPSVAYQRWVTSRTRALDEIEDAHRSIGGSGPGRRYATQHINQAYAMLLSGQFQGFCRDLHTECVGELAKAVTPSRIQPILQLEWVWQRRLDRGNPTPTSLAADFDRLGMKLWDALGTMDARNLQRRRALEELNEWRNAIAHQDFDPSRLGGATQLRLRQVRDWRGACHGLAESLDRATSIHLAEVLGQPPW